MKCLNCNHELDEPTADRVSISGMFDMHLFHSVDGNTVDEIIENWRSYIAQPIPAIVGDRRVDDMGPSALCPAVVLSGKKELRRVGQMVHPDYQNRTPRSEDAVDAYRSALLTDPDISRLLAERAS